MYMMLGFDNQVLDEIVNFILDLFLGLSLENGPEIESNTFKITWIHWAEMIQIYSPKSYLLNWILLIE